MEKLSSHNTVLADLKSLLIKGGNTSQESLSQTLMAMGHQVNQSKISRLLKKLNAIKYKNEMGEMEYRLPHDNAPPPIDTKLNDLIIDIVCNEAMIIIKTSPGSAQLIARILDFNRCKILGTIAGDDAVFVAPQSIARIEESVTLIKKHLCL